MSESLSSIEKGKDSASGGHDYAVMLPCSPDSFGEFISGLLGKPQVIEGYVDGYFELSRDDIVNIFHLVNQRIAQQNEAQLIQFSVLISYDDNSTVILNSLQDFMTYAEVKSRVSIGFQLSWTYLVKFIGKQVPEKQTIDVSYRTGRLSRYSSRLTTSSEKGELYNGFYFRICHTARSWGVDIESLLTGHLGALKRANTSDFRLWISERIGFISFFICTVLFIISNIGLIFTIKTHSETQTREFSTRLASVSDKNGEAIMYLASQGIGGGVASYLVYILVYMMITIIFIIFFAIILRSVLHYSPTGALLLTNQAESEYEFQQRELSKSWLDSSIAIVGALIVGVASNFLFLWITTHWM
ncbi:hypothetical protein [Methylosinus sporium]|uniref:hypothetical protein n=1 Tax=Methylosinus sporium TaxID=428 RepID=UPI0011B213FA|nr:hypothetical protein [Methylosinus sporium]